jgi:hypothetical protein
MVLLASSYDKSRFFKAADIDRERKLRIKTVTEELIGTEKEKKLVVWFTNDERGLPLNRTNNRTIRSAFGDACDGWKGRIIILFKIMSDVRGQMKDAIRVRIPDAAAKPAAAASGNGQRSSDDPDIAESYTPAKPPADDLNDEIPW